MSISYPEGATLVINATLVSPTGTAIDLQGSTGTVIKAKKPNNGATLSLPATVTSGALGKMTAELPAADLYGIGPWAAWPVAVDSTGRTIKGLAKTFVVVEEGTVG